MSIFSELQTAATEAQSAFAQTQGAAAGVANFIGADGKSYFANFRPADAFESAAASREMMAHGFNDRSVTVAVATRTQFLAPPLDWRRKKCTRLFPTVREGLVADMSDDDPLHYVFTLLIRQT